MGKRHEAQKVLDALLEQSEEAYVSPTGIVIVCFALGKNDQGFEWLDEAYENGDWWLSWLKISPLYDSVRSDPRFKALLKKVGLDK